MSFKLAAKGRVGRGEAAGEGGGGGDREEGTVILNVSLFINEKKARLKCSTRRKKLTFNEDNEARP